METELTTVVRVKISSLGLDASNGACLSIVDNIMELELSQMRGKFSVMWQSIGSFQCRSNIELDLMCTMGRGNSLDKDGKWGKC